MAGGIYVDQPFYINPKCIIFGLTLMSGYWFLPYQNIFILPLLFIIGYIAMAWYDHFYECGIKLYSGTGYGISVVDSIFKPQRRLENVSSNQEIIYGRNVYLFHTFIIAPLLFYIGIKGKKSDERVFPVIAITAIVAFMYHFYRLFNPR